MKKRLDEHREALLEIHEDSEGGSSWMHWNHAEFNQWPHIFNLTNCIVGVSVLAMPYCLQQCGILLGTVLIALCSLLTKVTCHLLYKGAVITRRRSYEALGLYAFGSGGRRVIETLMLLYLMSTIVSFMVVMGDIGPHVLADYLQLQAPTHRMRILVMVFVFLFVILPLSFIRNLDSLSVISSITVFFYFIFVIRMLMECIPRIFDGEWSSDVHWWRKEGLLNSLPIISMALSCQTQMFCVADCVKDPATAKVDTIVSGAVNICSAIYAAVGLFGYVAFHDKQIHGDILLYLHPSLLTQWLKLVFMLSIAVSVPLMLFPCRNACYNLLLRPSIGEYTMNEMPAVTFVVLTVLLLLIDLLIAVLVPNVEFILGLTGALIGSLVTIIIPSVLFIVVCPYTKSNESLVVYAKISVVVGALMLVGSTWTVLHTERQSNVVDVILPKEAHNSWNILTPLPEREPLIKWNATERFSNEKLEAKDIEKKKAEIGEEARKILAEMKEQRKEQDKMIKEQQQIVKELNEHRKMHIEKELERVDERTTIRNNASFYANVQIEPMEDNGAVNEQAQNSVKEEIKEVKRRNIPEVQQQMSTKEGKEVSEKDVFSVQVGVSREENANEVRRKEDLKAQAQLSTKERTTEMKKSEIFSEHASVSNKNEIEDSIRNESIKKQAQTSNKRKTDDTRKSEAFNEQSHASTQQKKDYKKTDFLKEQTQAVGKKNISDIGSAITMSNRK